MPLPAALRRVTLSVPIVTGQIGRITFERDGTGFAENQVLRDLHPMVADRLKLWRLANFHLRRLPAADDVYLFEATSRANPRDRRLMALADLHDLTPLRDSTGKVIAIPALEQVLDSCLDGIRRAMADFGPAEPPHWSRIVMHAWPLIEFDPGELLAVLKTLAPRTGGLGLEQVGLQGRTSTASGEVRLRMIRQAGTGLSFEVTSVPDHPLKHLDAYAQLMIKAARRDTPYPYELIRMLLKSQATAARSRVKIPWPVPASPSTT